VCSHKTKNASLSRLETIWTESCSSIITEKNKAHIIPQLFLKATFQVYMYAAPQNLHFTLKCMIVLKWSHIMKHMHTLCYTQNIHKFKSIWLPVAEHHLGNEFW
jgi:hypothetical protein